MHMHVRGCGLSTPIRVLSLYLPPPTPAGPVSSGSVFLELGPASRKLSESTGTTGHQGGEGGEGDEMLLAAGGGQAGVMEGMVWRWRSSIRKKNQGLAPRMSWASWTAPHPPRTASRRWRSFSADARLRKKRGKKGIVGQPCNRPPADGNVVTVGRSRSMGDGERERESRQRCWTRAWEEAGGRLNQLVGDVCWLREQREKELLFVWAGA
ncbi:hypothetical protein CCHR01_08888 [Colletotrichum chrysophilum]|uniref:Uncharacterized protein n=1 Tax=Colletotrichum chrysophilum TaxID=1836956 RepID=A0AAD9AKQ4_9PEZI|nr:hypothetical protein CCHR01_08888 [Colletotrichum chrysophilum]